MTLYLLRHAKAGSRSSWSGDDRLRPLSGAGRRQAVLISEALADLPITRILSSPYARCVETAALVAEPHGLRVEEAVALAEGAPLPDVLALADAVAAEEAVLCSHGDVIPMLLEELASTGIDLGPEPRCQKGSIWIVEAGASCPPPARYVPPPSG